MMTRHILLYIARTCAMYGDVCICVAHDTVCAVASCFYLNAAYDSDGYSFAADN